MDKIKVVIIAIFTALTAWMGVLAMPVYLLVGLGISDYFTGVVAAVLATTTMWGTVALA